MKHIKLLKEHVNKSLTVVGTMPAPPQIVYVSDPLKQFIILPKWLHVSNVI
jgi:hypothetical protein